VNVLCLPGDLLGERPIDRLLEVWLKTEFEGGRHSRRLGKIRALESNRQAESSSPD
ncbi:MAG: RpiB/LacA/LacB family sugar-phosphate isomerase, partial [Planctomycetes bacterium]|nr:RpiB/LacA/LacB family sugar-phosphate isomerase [Planctomycetota bacterium]